MSIDGVGNPTSIPAIQADIPETQGSFRHKKTKDDDSSSYPETTSESFTNITTTLVPNEDAASGIPNGQPMQEQEGTNVESEAGIVHFKMQEEDSMSESQDDPEENPHAHLAERRAKAPKLVKQCLNYVRLIEDRMTAMEAQL